MIEPSNIKKAFKKVEKENHAFRRYLKNNVHPDELDGYFKELHQELFSEYDCSKCRNCCKKYSIVFAEYEIEPAAELLNISKKDFKDRYIEMTGNGLEVKEKPCCFLSENGECKIEECKPEDCREYPYTNKPDRLFSLLNIVDFSSVCPVVYEMLERLKDIYEF